MRSTRRLIQLMSHHHVLALMGVLVPLGAVLGVLASVPWADPQAIEPTSCLKQGVAIRSLVLSPDGKRIASVDIDGTIKHWDRETGLEWSVSRKEKPTFAAMAFSLNGRYLAFPKRDSAVVVRDVASGDDLAVFPIQRCQSLAFSPDGVLLAMAGVDDGMIVLWDWVKDQEKKRFGPGKGIHLGITFAEGGRIVASIASTGVLELWEIDAGIERSRVQAHSGPTSMPTLASSPDGALLASACFRDPNVQIWEVATGRLRGMLRGSEPGITTLAFTPDGKQLAAAGSDGVVRFWDLVSGGKPRTFHPCTSADAILAIAISQDGRTLATGGTDQVIQFWDLGRLLSPESPDQGADSH